VAGTKLGMWIIDFINTFTKKERAPTILVGALEIFY